MSKTPATAGVLLANVESRVRKAGRSRICLSDNGKILKADCGFGLDDSKSSDALLLRCSDAEIGQDHALMGTKVKGKSRAISS